MGNFPELLNRHLILIHYHDIWLNNPDKIARGEILVINGNEEANTSQFIENGYYDLLTRKLYDFIFTL